MKMPAHAFVGCKIARDLEKLDTEKHGHPCQLEGGPDREYDCEWVFVEDFAKLR